jgi:hypothetical protein
LDIKGADKVLQPMLEYLTITGGERRRSSIARLSWTNFHCAASLQAEIEAEDQEESGAAAAKLKELVELSRRNAGVHRRISTEGMTNPARGRPKRNIIDCSFVRRPTDERFDFHEAQAPVVERTSSDSIHGTTQSEKMSDPLQVRAATHSKECSSRCLRCRISLALLPSRR